MSVVDFPQAGTIGANLKPKRYDIELYQGDTFQFDLVLKDSLGAAINITGWTVLAQIKDATGAAAPAPVFTTTVAGSTGTITVKLGTTGTGSLLEAVTYKYDVQLTDGSGNIRTYIGGKITVTEDISE